ncbi:MAG: topoisomerase C-terminal repeat-containing protein [Clostridia bacterium]|nr:topoisomerase C-terminal repeat-containing protein [Clostridia bacterium]
MNMILIIAEKPSLARNICAGIGQMQKKNGYFEGCGYLVSWAFGHLFGLCDIESYRPLPEGQKYWCMDNLPCFPSEFRYELRKGDNGDRDDGVIRQFKIIEDLCNRPDVDKIVNAGDADREGEIIVRTCVNKALKKPKPLLRLWLPDQTPETVAAALRDMKSEDEYDNLANEGYARTFIDWLYGVNLTRYATLKSGKLLRVGRVIVPIVLAIYERDMAIRNFVPDIYYALVSKAETNGEMIELQSKTKFDKTDFIKAKNLCDQYNAVGATVTDVKKKKDTLSPGKLYSLSKLQNVLGKKYKMSMAESLEIVQKLYEEGYLTYPRTNSEYLATAEKDKIRKIIENCKKLGYPLAFKDKKTIFDDSKIESHSALTPTYKIPDKSRLSEKEMQVYSTVFRRFVAVFCAEDCVVNKSEIKIAVGDLEEFALKGTVIVERGWTKYDDYSGKDKVLPQLNKGDAVNINFEPVEKETNPPKHYTIETLNNYLKNPFKQEKAQENSDPEKADDTEEYKAIFEGLELGTEATRTGIIDNARKSGYIKLNKDVYTILPDGEYLIESLKAMQISMDKYKTAELGKSLKRVFRGECSVGDSVELAKAEISEVFDRKGDSFANDTDIGFFMQTVGKCPLCGGEVRRTNFGYGCGSYRENGCKFAVSMRICSRVIPLSAVKQLLTNGRTEKLSGFVSKKSGKSFEACLKLEDGRAVFDFN